MDSSRRNFLGVVSAVGGVGISGCNTGRVRGDEPSPTPSPVSNPWPMFRHDTQNTGVTDATGPTAPVTKQWKVDFNPDRTPFRAPTAEDMRVADEGRIEYVSPTVVGTTVYVGVSVTAAKGPHVYALSIADGTERWRYDLDKAYFNRISSTPAVVDDTVFAASHGAVYAFAAAEDTDRWAIRAEDEFPWVSVRARNDQWYAMDKTIYASPAVVDGIVYISNIGGTVSALDAADGTVQWRSDLNAKLKSLAVAADTVYVGGPGFDQEPHTVHALAAADGTERWHYTLDNRAPRGVAVENDTVYVSTRSDEHNPNTLYALAADDGTERWTTQPAATLPAVTDDTVYVGGEEHVYAFDAVDGTERWRYHTLGVPGPPVVADDTVYIAGSDRTYALATVDGTEQWNIQGSIAPGSSPAIVDDTVYLISANDSVYTITGE